MKILWITLALGASLLIGLMAERIVPASPYSYHRLVWNDEFEGKTLDSAKWRAMIGTGPEEGFPQYWGNNERQYYTADNAVVSGGKLSLLVKKEERRGQPYTSARLTTSNLFAFTYGRVEARMKLPAGVDGLWPAFWLLPDGLPQDWAYGPWAASGELDVMEARSRLPKEISGAAHYGGAWPAQAFSSGKYDFPPDESVTGWHVYTLEKFPEKLVWYVDGKAYFTLTDWYTQANDQTYPPPAPYDQPFCIMLNVAVGGNFDEGRLPGEDFARADALIDWVRVYE
jgi:beta-glucanase (GH16 family)